MSAVASQESTTIARPTPDEWERLSDNKPSFDEESGVEVVAEIYYAPTRIPSNIVPITLKLAEEIDTSWEVPSKASGDLEEATSKKEHAHPEVVASLKRSLKENADVWAELSKH